MANETFGGLFKQAKDSGAFDNTLPDGDYVLRIVKSNAKVKANGEDSIGIQFEVVRSEVEGDLGKKTWHNLHFSERAAPISFRFLGDLGLSDEFIGSASSAEEVAEAVLGVEVDTEIGHRKWGKNEENVSNTFKVVGLVTPPAVGADPSVAVVDDEEPF